LYKDEESEDFEKLGKQIDPTNIIGFPGAESLISPNFRASHVQLASKALPKIMSGGYSGGG